jgi:hypothetical protein
MSSFLIVEGELIVGQESVQLNCMRILQRISGEAPPRTVKELEFPSLCAITQEEVQWLQWGCS